MDQQQKEVELVKADQDLIQEGSRNTEIASAIQPHYGSNNKIEPIVEEDQHKEPNNISDDQNVDAFNDTTLLNMNLLQNDSIQRTEKQETNLTLPPINSSPNQGPMSKFQVNQDVRASVDSNVSGRSPGHGGHNHSVEEHKHVQEDQEDGPGDDFEDDAGSDFEANSSHSEDSQSSEEAKDKGLLSQGFNAVTDNKLMKGLGSGIGAIGGAIGGVTGFTQKSGEEEDRSGEKSASDLKNIYMKNYSLQFEIPSQDIQSSIFYPSDANFVIQSQKFNLPQGENYTVATHRWNGQITNQRFNEVYAQKKDGIILRLIQQDEDLNHCPVIKEVIVKDEIPKKVNETTTQYVQSAQLSFSNNGKYFFMFMKQLDTIRIYEVKNQNLLQLMEDIQNQKFIYQFDDNDIDVDSLAFVKYIKIGVGNKYVALVGKHKVMVIDIVNQGQEKPFEFDILKYSHSRLETIYDVHLESTKSKVHPVKCLLACKMLGHKKIKIIDTYGHHDQKETNERIINFFNDKAPNFNVKIMHNNENILAILANGQENFILECSANGTTKQRNLSQLHNLTVHYIKQSLIYEQGFYMIASQPYDQYLTILNSEIPEFNVQIKRNVLPNIITIQDIFIDDINQNTQQIRLTSLLDDEFVLDKVQREKYPTSKQMTIAELAARTMQKREQKYHSYKFSSISAFSTCWPYIVFSGLSNFVMITNVFNKEHLHRIQIAEEDESCKICESFISDTKDLFVMILKNGMYMLYMLDLNELNYFKHQDQHQDRLFKFQLLLEYEDSFIDHQPLKDMHVRGSSRKEVIQLNQKLIVFLLHDDNMYSWIEQKEEKLLKNDIKKVNNAHERVISNSFQEVDNNLFYYQCELGNENDDNVLQQIKKCEVLFGEFIISQEYLEVSQQLQLMSFNIDQTYQNLLLVLRPYNVTKGGKNQVYIKIWDSEGDKMIFENYIQNPNLLGIFLSEAFCFVGDHMYFNNNVIKIRVDIMRQHKRNVTEDQLYTEYTDIFNLEKGYQVKINSPLQAVGSHKFTYILYSPPSRPGPKKLLVTPYLHERKIYLNRMKMNTKYFYTTFKSDYVHKSQCEAENHITRSEGDEAECDGKVGKKWINLIACINLVESKLYLYMDNGVLVQRRNFLKEIHTHGEVISTSHNGLNYIFKKKNKSEFSILKLEFNGFRFIKTIDILAYLSKYVEKNNLKEEHTELFEHDNWVFDPKKCNYTILINNNEDVVIKIKQTQNNTKNNKKGLIGKKSLSDVTLCYFIAGWFKESNNESIIKKNTKTGYSPLNLIQKQNIEAVAQNLLILSSKQNQKYDCCINSNYLFLWDRKKIEFYDLRLPMVKANKLNINFRISVQQKNAFIKTLVPGNDPYKIAIVVEQLQDSTVFSWNILEDSENEAYNINKDHSIIFDQKGNITILDGDCLTISHQLCKVRAFDIENCKTTDIHQLAQKDGLGFSQGVRFDGEGNNWLILREYISLSFSYMTFVIKDRMEEITDFSNFAFDIEPYNYVINQTTCFLDGDMSRKNYLQLQYVLKNFERENLEYLELLHYTKSKVVQKSKQNSFIGSMGDMASNMKNKVDVLNVFGKESEEIKIISPLSLALKEGNNRCVEIILSFMAKIDYNASQKFISEMPNLTDYNSFMTYLQELPMQTQQMLEKQILKIQEPWDDEIVSIADSQCVYIDEDFYRMRMFEDKQNPLYKSIPVKITAMKVGWIINTDEGRQLLQNILQSDRLDYYDIPSLMMIIEFLYQRNKVYILFIPLPMYILQGIAFIATIFLSEESAKEYQKSQTLENNYQGTYLGTPATQTTYYISMINLAMTVFQLSIMAKMFQKMKLKFLQRAFTWYDLIFYVFNTLVTWRVFVPTPDMRMQRIFETFAIIFFLFKTFYFMKLSDKMAPLVSIVFQIVWDIKFFLAILILAIFCFGMAFYLQGNNQMDLLFNQKSEASIILRAAEDALQKAQAQVQASSSSSSSSGKTPATSGRLLLDIQALSKAVTNATNNLTTAQSNFEQSPVLQYSKFTFSIWYIWNLALGAGETGGFDSCFNIECQILTVLYVFSTFVFMLHLFNMLIAIMGDTFSKNNEVQTKLKIKDHLAFVLDNWYLNEIQREKTLQIKYIMSAFQIHEEGDDTEIIRAVHDRIDEIDEVMTKSLRAISAKQNEQDSFLRMIIKNQDRILTGQINKHE